MLGNLAEAFLTVVMVMIGPVGLALIVMLVLRLAKRHNRSGHGFHGER